MSHDAKLYHRIADIIESFVASMKPGWRLPKGASPYEWDDEFISERFDDPVLDRAAAEAADIDRTYPAEGQYCSEKGFERLREIARELRAAAGGEGAKNDPAT